MNRSTANADLSFCLLVGVDLRDSGPLEDALRRAGVRAETTQQLITPEQVPARATAIVWFVDGYPPVAVIATTARLRDQRPGLRIVLVTAWPQEFSALVLQATGRLAPVVVPGPARATEILEALRF